MNKIELKEKLHRLIDTLDDEMVLEMLYEAASEHNRAEEDFDELSPAQLKRLKESIKQIEAGNTITHEEVMILSRAWLQNKKPVAG